MKASEVQATRKMIFLTETEAALYLANYKGNNPADYWEKIESSEMNINSETIDKLNYLRDEYFRLTEIIYKRIIGSRKENEKFIYHMKYDDHKEEYSSSSIVDWRISQAIAANFAMHGYELIPWK